MAAAAKGGWLVPGAIAVLEERSDVAVSVDPSYLFLEDRIFGDTKVHFFRYQPV
jgi:16S rRNA (guanine966-N2)-methyltransferase